MPSAPIPPSRPARPDDRAAARALSALDLAAYLGDPSRKQAFVTPMFDVIAERYDEFTRLFSFGMDRRWKTELVRQAMAMLPTTASVALDLACGTGDLAMAIAAQRPGLAVTGIDASARMIDVARSRHAQPNARDLSARFVVGDAMRLDAGDASVDLLTAGYCYRNVPDWRAAICEAARVVKPGGVFANLDFFRPPFALWRGLFLWYLRRAGDVVGWAWHRAPAVYGYIAPSIAGFCTAEEFSSELTAAGFSSPSERAYLGGGVAIHVARR